MEKFEFLIQFKNPRSFLKEALRISPSKKTPITIAEFSRICHFSSRSFISEYLNDKKNLSKASFDRIKAALKIPHSYKKYFSLLVEIDQPELFNSSNLELITKQIAQLEYQILNLSALKDKNTRLQQVINKKNLFVIYASLGPETSGALLEEIVQKSKLPLDQVTSGLQSLIDHKLIQFNQNRYYPLLDQMDFFHFNSIELEELLKTECREIALKSHDIIKSEEDLIVYSAFSINKHHQKNFKNKLRSAVYQVMDEFQDDAGENIQQVFLCSRS
jgi:RNA polymerase III subunit RPC82 helix-turn-helix domain